MSSEDASSPQQQPLLDEKVEVWNHAHANQKRVVPFTWSRLFLLSLILLLLYLLKSSTIVRFRIGQLNASSLLRDPITYEAPAPYFESTIDPMHADEHIQEDSRLRLERVNGILLSTVTDEQIIISSNSPNTLEIQCHSEPGKYEWPCPISYRLLFAGPTLVSPLFANSTRSADGSSVGIQFTIMDPGVYKLYAWPEYENCQPLQELYGSALQTQQIANTPHTLKVVGSSPIDGFEQCQYNTVAIDGRWIATAAIRQEHRHPGSEHAWWLQPRLAGTPRYIWAPFSCKTAWRSPKEWMDLVEAPHYLNFGDSTLRDAFCNQTWFGLDGPTGTVCDVSESDDYHGTPKNMSYNLPGGQSSHVQWLWLPQMHEWERHLLTEYIKTSSIPLSHVLFSVGNWLTAMSTDEYASVIAQTLDILWEAAPQAVVALKEGPSAVSSIACWAATHQERRYIEPHNHILPQIVAAARNRGQQVALIPHYGTTNQIPHTGFDGRHWINAGQGWQDWPVKRPDVGYAEIETLNSVWHFFHQATM